MQLRWLKDNLIFVIVTSLLIIGLSWEFVSSHFFASSIENPVLETPSNNPSLDPFEIPSENDKTEPQKDHRLYVDIKGEVYQPGVYLVDPDDRVIDVIQSAGGFTMNADENQINLAEKVYDEMVIFVPNQSSANDFTIQFVKDDGKIRINTADQKELEELPGIGTTRALAIIQYRDENGPFMREDELLNISGIGQKIFDNLKEFIVVP